MKKNTHVLVFHSLSPRTDYSSSDSAFNIDKAETYYWLLNISIILYARHLHFS
jgi:hypothetical protein